MSEVTEETKGYFTIQSLLNFAAPVYLALFTTGESEADSELDIRHYVWRVHVIGLRSAYVHMWLEKR